jgi:photosystem II stability/assembly factor-like uncharacterized protein
MHPTTFRRRAASHALLALYLAACADATVAPEASSLTAATAAAKTPPVAWRPLNGPEALGALVVTPRGEIFGGDDVAGLWRSADDGATWQKIETLPAETGILALAVEPGGAIWAAATTGGILRSHDGGRSWVPAGLDDKWVTALAVAGDGIYAGAIGFSGGVYRSTDEGRSWSLVVPAVNPREFIIVFLAAHKGDLVVGTHSDNLLRAWNFGERWDWGTIQFHPDYLPFATAMVITDQATQLAALPSGIFRSTDAGDSWTRVFEERGVIRMTRDAEGAVLALDYDHIVHRSTDDGLTWTPVSVPLFARDARTFVATPSGRMLVGTFGGVYGTVGRR